LRSGKRYWRNMKLYKYKKYVLYWVIDLIVKWGALIGAGWGISLAISYFFPGGEKDIIVPFLLLASSVSLVVYSAILWAKHQADKWR